MSPIEIEMKFANKIVLLLFSLFLLIPFQNCSVYKSEGRKAFESSVEEAANKGCYPYIDTNIAAGFLGISDASLNVYKNKVQGENADTCDFYSENNLYRHINCKVSQGNGELAVLVKNFGTSAFEGIESIWAATPRTEFVGANHSGYVTLDSDGYNTIKFVALDGSEIMGVGCAVRLLPADYTANAAAVRGVLSKITFEMAINNEQ